jgi:hypothetical protein
MPQVAKRATGTGRRASDWGQSKRIEAFWIVLRVVRRLKNCGSGRDQCEFDFGEDKAGLTMIVRSESVRFISQNDAPRVPRDSVATVMLALNQRKPESKRPAWCRSCSGTRSIPLQGRQVS